MESFQSDEVVNGGEEVVDGKVVKEGMYAGVVTVVMKAMRYQREVVMKTWMVCWDFGRIFGRRPLSIFVVGRSRLRKLALR